MSKQYLPHPIAELFPLVTPTEVAELSADIAEKGLQNPITLFEGKILDGRHRYDACLLAEVAPRFVEYEGTDPVGFVLSGNLKRRHLTTSQRAAIAAELENMPSFRPKNKDANLRTSRQEAAKEVEVSERSVCSASKVKKESPKLFEQVKNGEISTHAAVEKIAEKKKEGSKEKEAVELDKVGRPIPKKILELWHQSQDECKTALDALSVVRSSLRHAQESKNPCYREVNFSSTISNLDSAYGDLKRIAPHAVCHVCQGLLPDNCPPCKGRGFVSKYFWDICVPSEFKNLFAKGK